MKIIEAHRRWGFIVQYATPILVIVFFSVGDTRWAKHGALEQTKTEMIHQRQEDRRLVESQLAAIDSRMAELKRREDSNRETIVELRITAARLVSSTEQLERTVDNMRVIYDRQRLNMVSEGK